MYQNTENQATHISSVHLLDNREVGKPLHQTNFCLFTSDIGMFHPNCFVPSKIISVISQLLGHDCLGGCL